MGDYLRAHARSLADPAGFWGEAAAAIDWDRPFDRVLDDSRPPFYRWFPGGMLNTCHNAVDRHVAAGRGDQAALIYDSPVTGTMRRFTYRELRDEIARVAGGLRSLGVEKGDRVIIYMPMIPEAVIVDAGLRPHRRHPLGRLRRLRRQGAGHPHRRRQAAGDPVGLVRHRGRPG